MLQGAVKAALGAAGARGQLPARIGAAKRHEWRQEIRSRRGMGFGPLIAMGSGAMEQFWIPNRAIAACIGLLGFTVAVMSGLLSGAESEQILLRALVAMGGCIVLGRGVLWATRLCLQEHMAEYEAAHPVPDSSGIAGGLRGLAKKDGADRAESAG